MLQDIRTTLNVSIDSPFWNEAITEAEAMPRIPQWLCAEFVLAVDKDYSLLGDFKESVLQALTQVTDSPALCLFAKTLFHIIGKKQPFKKSFSSFSLPKAPADAPNLLGYDYVGLFPILAHVRQFSHELAARGISHDVIHDTLSFLRSFIMESCEQEGRPCFNETFFALFPAYHYTKYLWIGRLRFEILPNSNCNVRMFTRQDGKTCLLLCDTVLHASGNILDTIGFSDAENAFPADYCETDEFYEGYAVNPETHRAETVRTRLAKPQWREVIKPGDTLLKVHIPVAGRLLKEDCEAAYAQARQVFPKCYPEYDFKGFVCCSWLLCPSLRTFLKEDSNIVSFQQKYHLFPAKDTGADVFLYVFDKKVSSADEVDFSSLPQSNTMQRGVKNLLLAGEYIHNYGGLIPF